MDNSLHITEIAIFSLETFTFGVDTKQIQEILTVDSSAIIGETDPSSPFFIMQYHSAPLPVFDIRRHFCLSSEPKHIVHYPVVTFQTTPILAACWVTTVEDIQAVSWRALHPVPPLLTNFARQNHVWGFYEMSDRLIPLLDPEQVISAEDIDLYVTFCQNFRCSQP